MTAPLRVAALFVLGCGSSPAPAPSPAPLQLVAAAPPTPAPSATASASEPPPAAPEEREASMADCEPSLGAEPVKDGFGPIGLLNCRRTDETTTAGGARPGSTGGRTVRQGTTQVNGRLPAEAIQRVVRQHFSLFRDCYDAALTKNKKLAGRAAVQFTIEPSGAVTGASDGGSDLPAPALRECLVRSFASLSFPQPESGTVSVRSVLVFTPAAAKK